MRDAVRHITMTFWAFNCVGLIIVHERDKLEIKALKSDAGGEISCGIDGLTIRHITWGVATIGSVSIPPVLPIGRTFNDFLREHAMEIEAVFCGRRA
jgi:hypothetical protein